MILGSPSRPAPVLNFMCTKTKDSRFMSLGTPERVWAISAIHGDAVRLTELHDQILSRFKPGDKLVYLGNYTGYSDSAAECVDEILTFRRLMLCMQGVLTTDLVYLRGAQEEMWQKLLQLQFAPDPAGVLLWMLGNGLSDTLYSYGLSPHDGIEACQQGVMGLTRWTNTVRAAIRKHPGHEVFGTQLLRAAHTHEVDEYPLLFVHSGLNANKPLSEQGDHFWWAGERFSSITAPYTPFQKVIRGYDPAHGGVKMNCVTATIDGGCGFGGTLVCAGWHKTGEVIDILEI
jgi:hypothetical protein